MSLTRRKDITIAICTKSRPDSLLRCINSISRLNSVDKISIDLLVIDDGHITVDLKNRIVALLPAPISFSYFNKTKPSLYQSRRMAVEKALSELIAFFDDDVELEPDYIEILFSEFSQKHEIVAIGGVDILSERLSLPRRIFRRTFMIDSGLRGTLSLSGQNGEGFYSKDNRPFATEYLSGCCMAFRKKAIGKLPDSTWLDGYSMGEDLFLSRWAARTGSMMIHPGCKVRHHQEKASRESDLKIAISRVFNHTKFLRFYNFKKIYFFWHQWTITGLIISSMVKGRFDLIKAYSSATHFLETKPIRDNNSL